MGIYIKGMEMPKNCYECDFCTYGYCSNLNRYIDNSQERDSDCPLVSVPPHGRLIDADALLNLLSKCMFPSDMVTTTAVSMGINWIKEAPTVIEAEDGE